MNNQLAAIGGFRVINYSTCFGSQPKQYGKPGDVCVECGTKLSSYNPLDLCSGCVKELAARILELTNRSSFRLTKHKRRMRAQSNRVW